MMTTRLVSIRCSFLTKPGGKSFFQSWNGCSFLQYPQWAPLPDFEVSSDASGALGYGAVFQGHWFSGAWLPSQVSQSIEYKELFPIVVAAYLWGPQWASKRVNFLSDNRSVVDILRSGTSRAPTIISWFAICPCWQLVTPSRSLPPQLEGSRTTLLTPCLAFSFSAFAG